MVSELSTRLGIDLEIETGGSSLSPCGNQSAYSLLQVMTSFRIKDLSTIFELDDCSDLLILLFTVSG
jgi:hypothetical protein